MAIDKNTPHIWGVLTNLPAKYPAVDEKVKNFPTGNIDYTQGAQARFGITFF
jgi:hypothetical protein